MTPPAAVPHSDRLHVCFVVQEWLPGQLNGIARLTHTRACGLAERGHTVRVLTTTSRSPSVSVENGLHVHRIRSEHHALPPGEVTPQLLWDRSASVLDELLRVDGFQPIDIVDIPNWDVEGLATILDGRFATVLGLYTSIASYVAVDGRFRPDDPVYAAVIDAERRCYAGAAAFTAGSDAIVEEIEQFFGVSLPRDRLARIDHGLAAVGPPAPFQAPPVDAEHPLEVLFVGRCEARKGIETLLRAVPRIAAEVRDVRFTIVGDDTVASPRGSTYRDEFMSSWAGCEFGSLVTFEGVLDDVEVNQRYRRADVAVVPSLFESFGLVAVEAMRVGTPVVASDTSGLREVVGGDGAGVLVPPDDPQLLADAVVQLLRDPHRRARLGRAGYERYVGRYTAERMVDELERFFDDLSLRVRATAGDGPGAHR